LVRVPKKLHDLSPSYTLAREADDARAQHMQKDKVRRALPLVARREATDGVAAAENISMELRKVAQRIAPWQGCPDR